MPDGGIIGLRFDIFHAFIGQRLYNKTAFYHSQSRPQTERRMTFVMKLPPVPAQSTPNRVNASLMKSQEWIFLNA